MPNYNKAIIIGHLTRDIELRSISGGTQVGKFTLAVNDSYTSKAGEKKESVAFIDCQAWGKTAENIAKYVGKGSALMVEGKIKQDTWEDKDGNKRSKLYVHVDTFTFIGDRKATDSAPATNPEENRKIDSGDIPF